MYYRPSPISGQPWKALGELTEFNMMSFFSARSYPNFHLKHVLSSFPSLCQFICALVDRHIFVTWNVPVRESKWADCLSLKFRPCPWIGGSLVMGSNHISLKYGSSLNLRKSLIRGLQLLVLILCRNREYQYLGVTTFLVGLCHLVL
jgi:hypothetical protein